MTNRWLVVLVIASLALNLAVVAGFFISRPRGPRDCGPMPGMGPGEMRRFGEMRKGFDPQMDSLRERLNEARGRLFDLAADSVEPAEAESLIQSIGQIREDMNRMAYQHLRLVLREMTPDNRARFLRRLQSGPPHGHGGPHRRHGGRMPPPPPEFDDR